MSREIMTTLPLPPYSFTSRACKKLSCIAHIRPCGRITYQLALTPCKAESAIDQRRPKEPLGHKDPKACDHAISHGRLYPFPAKPAPTESRIKRQEHSERNRSPKPSNFDEVNIEDIPLLRKV